MNPAAPASVTVGSDGALHLAGRIGYANAEWMLPRGRAALADGKVGRIDLTALEQPDSATLAMLLVWAAEATRAGRLLTISGAPRELRALAQLCDAEALLRLQ